MCCNFFRNRTASYSALDWDRFDLPTQGELISRFLDDRKVRKVDYAFNGFGTVLGVGLVAFSVCLFLMMHGAFGWKPELTPFYVLMGGVGGLGGTLTLISIKWMVDSCKKSSKNDTIINAALYQ